jgi:tetratricopeptide (TPR) repeat protein
MSPRHIAPGIPRKLEKVILRCMEKDPGRRFQTYSELISELEATYRVVRDPAVLTSCDFFEIVVRPRYSETAILNNRACSYMELGHHVEALALFDQVLKQAPEDVHALCNKGHALEQLNRYHEAIGCYDRALEIDPGDGQACLDKANSLAALGRHEGALPCYEGALDRNPQDAHTWYNMGNTLVLHDSCFWGWVFVSQHLHRGARDPVEERFDEEVQRAVDGG